jgi:translocator protein
LIVRSRAVQAAALAGWLLLCFAAAALGALFPPDAWFVQLQKPAWQPPNWLFGPVWTTLYAMMAVAAWLVWRRHGFSHASGPLTLFLVQLAFNAAWSPVFFGMRQPGLAFIVIVVLLTLIVATTVAFWRHQRAAGMLLLPYLVWVSFATLLNWAIWRMNVGG